MKRFQEVTIFLVAVSVLVIPVVQIYSIDPYVQISPRFFVLPSIVFTTFLVFLLIRYKTKIQQVVLRVQALGQNRRNVWIFLLMVLQISVASFSYTIYYFNPQLYVVGDEIENRYVQITRSERESELNYVNEFHSNTKKDILLLKYLQNSIYSFHSSSDGTLSQNDSILISFEYPLPPPGGQGTMVMKVYTKKDLAHISTFHSRIMPLDTVLAENLEELERKAAVIKNDFAEISANENDFRWSYLHFLSYYFREQLQAMSPLLIVIDAIKYSVWLAISLLFSSPLWSKRNSDK